MTINATGIQAEGGGFFTKWKVLHGPEFVPQETYEDLKNPNFVIIDFEDKTIIIGGTSYTGEIKKSIFTVLNTIFIDHGVLPMHCSANANSKNGKGVNLFFGLSGTGKTTLSSDPNKFFIGDDEHGWFEDHIFNFEGGCYAKLINLKKENEPIIWDSIYSPDRFNHTNCSLMENIVVDDENNPDFSDSSITENIRASYSLGQLPEEFMVDDLGLGKNVKNIFFLSFDAFGVLPPISKLDLDDAARFFKMGYTSKVAGTEVGVTEPTVVFSTCFGSPFLPRKVEDYVDLFKEKVRKSGCNVWLVNTGFDENLKRYPIDITRKVINGVIDGKYSEKTFDYHGLKIPNRILDLDLITLKPDIEEERIEKLFELLDQH
jgi:phosphoenolpyruvate carboxykinase (ATP)